MFDTFKTYSELCRYTTFEDRYRYLMLDGQIGIETFGSLRHLNQSFYRSREWRNVRTEVILRDQSLDLGISEREIFGTVFVHHMNPITPEMLIDHPRLVLNPEYLICVSRHTHSGLHMGIVNIPKTIVRKRGDTNSWTRLF